MSRDDRVDLARTEHRFETIIAIDAPNAVTLAQRASIDGIARNERRDLGVTGMRSAWQHGLLRNVAETDEAITDLATEAEYRSDAHAIFLCEVIAPRLAGGRSPSAAGRWRSRLRMDRLSNNQGNCPPAGLAVSFHPRGSEPTERIRSQGRLYYMRAHSSIAPRQTPQGFTDTSSASFPHDQVGDGPCGGGQKCVDDMAENGTIRTLYDHPVQADRGEQLFAGTLLAAHLLRAGGVAKSRASSKPTPGTEEIDDGKESA